MSRTFTTDELWLAVRDDDDVREVQAAFPAGATAEMIAAMSALPRQVRVAALAGLLPPGLPRLFAVGCATRAVELLEPHELASVRATEDVRVREVLSGALSAARDATAARSSSARVVLLQHARGRLAEQLGVEASVRSAFWAVRAVGSALSEDERDAANDASQDAVLAAAGELEVGWPAWQAAARREWEWQLGQLVEMHWVETHRSRERV